MSADILGDLLGMDPVAQALASIKAAQLPAELYRTARELLDLAGESGHVKISKIALMEICQTGSDGTMRRQLGILKKHNIIHVSTNEHVYITFVAFPTIDAPRTARAPVITARAPTRAPCAQAAPPQTYDATTPRTARAPVITARAPTRAPCALPHTRAVRSFVRSYPTDTENERTNEHAPKPAETAGHEPQSEEQVRSVALLTDAEVGLSAADARRIAARYSLEDIARQVFEWRRQLQAGVVRHTGALLTRFERSFSAVVIPDDRRTDLWQRHMTEPGEELDADGDSAAQRHAAYVPAGYELPTEPIHRADPNPEPDPGTPDHAWWQVRSELETEPGGSFARWLDSTHVLAHDPASNSFTVACSALALDWLNSRLARQISRKLTIITGRPAAVQFTAQGD